MGLDALCPCVCVCVYVCCVAKGKTSKEYLEIKKMAFKEPDLLHAILKNLADSIGDYANYQVRCIIHNNYPDQPISITSIIITPISIPTI